MLEVEVKARITGEGVEKKLWQIGAVLLKEEKQIDFYFSHPCRDFKKTDEALRVRRVGDNLYLTYKGPKTDLETKTRKEVETRVEEEIFLLLGNLGFTLLKQVVKKREFYQWEGLRICIDEVENLGRFLEIEGKEIAQKDRIFHLLNRLDIPFSSLIRKSYLELIMEKEKGK